MSGKMIVDYGESNLTPDITISALQHNKPYLKPNAGGIRLLTHINVFNGSRTSVEASDVFAELHADRVLLLAKGYEGSSIDLIFCYNSKVGPQSGKLFLGQWNNGKIE